jgi:heat shock protein HspQ
MSNEAKFLVGQIIQHQLFGYRGVIYEIDPMFMLSAEWYDQMARSRPPKDKPWYHVLVDNGVHSTYVAEQNLMAEPEPEPIRHPAIDDFFDRFEQGKYLLKKRRLQ